MWRVKYNPLEFCPLTTEGTAGHVRARPAEECMGATRHLGEGIFGRGLGSSLRETRWESSPLIAGHRRDEWTALQGYLARKKSPHPKDPLRP